MVKEYDPTECDVCSKHRGRWKKRFHKKERRELRNLDYEPKYKNNRIASSYQSLHEQVRDDNERFMRWSTGRSARIGHNVVIEHRYD